MLLTLDDPAAEDAAVAGGKAATLARARRRGLPVLDGYVVPAPAARASVARGAEALATRGSGGARLATMGQALDDDLVAALAEAVTTLGGEAIVRSSTDLEAGGAWSGAFSSFADIDRDTVPTAVRGCWASLFGVDAIERFEAEGIDPTDVAVGVLIQPQLHPTVAGIGRSRADGSVEIVATDGPPAALVGGWARGSRATAGAQGAAHWVDEPLAGDDMLGAVTVLVRAAEHELGCNVIEWAWDGHAVTLLQATTVATPDAPAATTRREGSDYERDAARRLATWAARFPGQVCDDLVHAWALGAQHLDPEELRETSPMPDADLATVRTRAAELAAQVFATSPTTALDEARAFLRELRSPAPGPALDRLQTLRRPDPRAAREVVAGLLGLGEQLLARGAIATLAQVLRLRPDELEQRLAADVGGPAPRVRDGAGPWEPFLFGVAWSNGDVRTGTPAGPGVGAGPARVITSPGVATPAVRAVIVAPLPFAGLAPLLWSAAGLVTTGGSAGAHLMEVAHSLGVPVVVGCDLEGTPIDPSAEPARPDRQDVVVAIDGDAGHVAFCDLAGTPSVPGDG